MIISIVIPVYNVAPYVRRCLESVMAQDKAAADLECIIVDDCGQDNSMEIVRQTVEEYKGPVRFVILGHEHNRGLSAARNTGLAKATGDYVLFIDSDDCLMPGTIPYFLDNLAQHPDADMVAGNVINHKAGDNLQLSLEKPLYIDDCTELFLLLLCHQTYVQVWNKLMRRQVLVEHGLDFIEGILFEDNPWTYHLFSCISSALFLPRVTYDYVDNDGSIMHNIYTQGKAEKALRSYVTIINDILDNTPETNRYKKNVTADYLLFLNNYLTRAVNLVINTSLPKQVLNDFRATRRRYMLYTLRKGRLLIIFFSLQAYFPFSYVHKLRLFRRYYDKLETAVNRLSHLTDFLHRV